MYFLRDFESAGVVRGASAAFGVVVNLSIVRIWQFGMYERAVGVPTSQARTPTMFAGWGLP